MTFSGSALLKKVAKMNSQVLIELLRDIRIILQHTKYKTESVEASRVDALRRIDYALATPTPIPDAGEGVEVVGHVNPKAFLNFRAGCTKEWMWAATAPDLKPVMYVEQHNRIVSALQASAMVVPDIARLEKHAMKAKDCLSECDVVLLSSIRRLLAASPAPGDSQ